VETWNHPYLHKPFENESEKDAFIMSRMVVLIIMLVVTTSHHYLTQLDMSVIVIEKKII